MYASKNRLTKAPNYFRLWMSAEKDDEMIAINGKLEALVEEMPVRNLPLCSMR